MIKPLAAITMLLMFRLGVSQDFETWKVLAEVEFEKSQDEYGEIFIPRFSENLRQLEGKEVVLSGYIIPFEGMFAPEHLILSSLPIASCFFCGSGGPETIAEVYLKSPAKYTAKIVTIVGKLELNDQDSNQLMFILREAELTIN